MSQTIRFYGNHIIHQEDIALASNWARFYQQRGLQPLPSRVDEKRPLCRFADYWEQLAPRDLFDRFASPNIQVMTGRHWRLMVIDLDGPEAIAQWRTMGQTPRTWITHSGGGGQHLWFRTPQGYRIAIPKAVLWRGQGEHSAIERLCDHSLVMVPPSLHPKTGQRYRFLDRDHSPARCPLPADCPGWIMNLEPIGQKTVEPIRPHQPRPTSPRHLPRQPRLDRETVLGAIQDKIALVQSWGVRIAGKPSPRGWVPCHAIDRDDHHPSAAIHRESGSYVDMGSGTRLSLFDLAASLAIYRDWREALDDLGGRYVR
jgi:Bifunctional DNA primase/polymerase, N-terminal